MILAVIVHMTLQCAAYSTEVRQREKVVLFLGDSLTSGYGVEEAQTYPARIQRKINSNRLNYKTINAGISGDTSSGALRRTDWLLKEPVDVLVLAIGTNDGLRGIPMEATEKNLEMIIDKVKAKNSQVKIIVAGMLIPPTMGRKYTDSFKEVFPRVAKKNGAKLIPFLLEGVAGEPSLNLPDGIHPTAEAYEKVADNVWAVLRPMIDKN